jgi:hypothetical protein
MKNEVYSWRVSTDLKSGLEREAQRRKISLSAVLELAARDWLNKGGAEIEDDVKQPRLQRAAAKCFGTLASGNAHRSENARQVVRQRLRLHYDR